MSTNFPVLRKAFSELVVAGSTERAEEAFSQAIEIHGDLAIVEVLTDLEPQITSLHLGAFDGGKLSLATLLVPPKAWAESLAFFAAKWREDDIDHEPEVLAEALFAHIHGVIFATDDVARRRALLKACSKTDHGIVALMILFSMAPHDILETADHIDTMQSYVTAGSENEHDVVPLAVELYHATPDGWEQVLYGLFPNYLHDPDGVREQAAIEDEDAPDAHRNTQELLYQLRKMVPTFSTTQRVKAKKHANLGADIFS